MLIGHHATIVRSDGWVENSGKDLPCLFHGPVEDRQVHHDRSNSERPIDDALAPPGPAVALMVSIAEIGSDEWDRCAGAVDPFLGHAYLSATERSGLVAPATGWSPLHLAVRDRQGTLVAAAPAYAKVNSNDEYWNDRSWAAGYEAAGGRYYPKLLIGVPFAPVSGRRFLHRPDTPSTAIGEMIRYAEKLARDHGLSSIHVTFPDEGDCRKLAEAGWLIRHQVQFEWRNRDYRDFRDFLDALTSRNRQRILRERRIVAQSGVRFRDVPGDRLGMPDILAYIGLLDDLHRRRCTSQPLTAEFICQLAAGFGGRLTLSFAEEDGVPVGAVLWVAGPRRLYVRNWGSLANRRFLHFECCYYRLIEMAIARGCTAIEGGYGGVHKLARGFEPKLTSAAHWFLHDSLRKAVADQDVKENRSVLAAFEELKRRSPFRRETA